MDLTLWETSLFVLCLFPWSQGQNQKLGHARQASVSFNKNLTNWVPVAHDWESSHYLKALGLILLFWKVSAILHGISNWSGTDSHKKYYCSLANAWYLYQVRETKGAGEVGGRHMLLFPLCKRHVNKVVCAGQGTCASVMWAMACVQDRGPVQTSCEQGRVCILLDFWAVLRPKEIWGIIREVPPNLCIRTYVHVKNGNN